MAFNLGFQKEYILNHWCMLFHSFNVLFKVFSILFKILSTYCDCHNLYLLVEFKLQHLDVVLDLKTEHVNAQNLNYYYEGN